MKRLAEKVITKHINRWDPERLIDMGAPDDEYESQIEEVVDAILDCRDEIELADVIKDVFDRYFGYRRKLDFDDCLRVAKAIWVELFEG